MVTHDKANVELEFIRTPAECQRIRFWEFLTEGHV